MSKKFYVVPTCDSFKDELRSWNFTLKIVKDEEDGFDCTPNGFDENILEPVAEIFYYRSIVDFEIKKDEASNCYLIYESQILKFEGLTENSLLDRLSDSFYEIPERVTDIADYIDGISVSLGKFYS